LINFTYQNYPIRQPQKSPVYGVFGEIRKEKVRLVFPGKLNVYMQGHTIVQPIDIEQLLSVFLITLFSLIHAEGEKQMATAD
jgi:hypothetical protein